jgi:hypothetical protein
MILHLMSPSGIPFDFPCTIRRTVNVPLITGAYNFDHYKHTVLIDVPAIGHNIWVEISDVLNDDETPFTETQFRTLES